MQPANLVRIFVLLLLPALFSPKAFAVCPVPEIKANGEFFKADLVFTAKVLTQRYAEHGDDAGWYYQLRVLEILKGRASKEITVYTEDASIRFPLEVGSDYLLFAYRWHNRLDIDSCGNSALLSGAADSIAQIKNIPRTPDGDIEGWLAPETDGVDLSGIHVVIRRGSRIYSVLTDNRGYFHFRAPAGKYTVDFHNHEYYLNDFDEYWYGPLRFRLHPGDTAALQLTSVRHRAKSEASHVTVQEGSRRNIAISPGIPRLVKSPDYNSYNPQQLQT